MRPDDQLIDAIKAHDRAGMEAALAAGAVLNEDRLPDYLPLSAAVLAGFEAGVDWLLSKGADVNQGGFAGGAVVLDRLPVLKVTADAPVAIQARIAQAMVDAEVFPLQRLLALSGWRALAEEQPQWLDQAIADVPDINAKVGRYTALVWAARHGTPGIVRRLLDAGSDVTLEFGGNPDPIAFCAWNTEHWVEIYSMLRAAGLPLRKFQAEPGVFAKNPGYLDRLLSETPRVEGLPQLLFTTAAKRDPAIAIRAIEAGLEIDASVLHAGISARDAALLTALIEAGADVNLADSRGLTPVMIAASNNPAAVGPLVAAGADVDAVTPRPHRYGHSALHTALRRRNWALVAQLLDLGATVPADSRAAYVATAIESGDMALVARLEGSPAGAAKPSSHGDPRGAPEELRPLAIRVARGDFAIKGISWRPFDTWKATVEGTIVAELPGQASPIAGMPNAPGPRVHASSLGFFWLSLLPRDVHWRVSFDIDDLAEVARLFGGGRQGEAVRRVGYLGMVRSMVEIENHMTMSPWFSSVPLALSGANGHRCCFRTIYSGSRVTVVSMPTLALHGSMPMVALVDGVPDRYSTKLIEKRNLLAGRHTPTDMPLDAVAGLEPAPMIGQADLTEMLGRNPDDPRAFRQALPNVWAHAMMGDPDDPAPHLRDFMTHSSSAVRFAAFSLAYGWQARDLMDAFRAGEANALALEMMNRPELAR